MFLRILKIIVLTLAFILIVSNIYIAADDYNLSKIHLSDSFYWQSVNSVLIDNKVDKVQVYGEGVSFLSSPKCSAVNGVLVIIYIARRDSHRKAW